jgi:hypothetical protein
LINNSIKPKEKLLASLKIGAFVVIALFIARLATGESHNWQQYAALFVLVTVGFYLTITFANWIERKYYTD